jgi:hypothetical protein
MWRSPRLPGLLAVAATLIVVASAQGSPPLIQQRVLRASELPGFKLDGQVDVPRSAQAWFNCKFSGRYGEAAALQARGYFVAAREHLYRTQAGLYAADADSDVIEFKTPGGAAAHLAQTFPPLPSSGEPKLFAVPGIPGAQAAATTAVDFNAYNIAFADGRFWYFVGVRYPPNAANPPTRASVIAAAQALYRRVHRA